MRRLKLFLVIGLFAIPLATLLGFGMYYVWWTGLGIWLWWPLSGCLVLGYILAWRWLNKRHLLRLDEIIPNYWTERDHEAWKRVEAHAEDAAKLKPDQLTSFSFYIETGEFLARDLAEFYHPKSQDPLATLTIPEILSVIELAAADLRKMVDQYLPGGHFLTINDMRRFKKLADWYPTASNITWLISSVFAPVNTAVRYLAVQAGTKKPWQLLQDNVLVWFFTAYVHRLGSYLIELNSGRLRVGVERYFELQKANSPLALDPAAAVGAGPAETARSVTFVLLGQAKVGKSSLVNSLLGEQQAATEVGVTTAGIDRYEVHPPEVPSRLQLFDTPGYGSRGPRLDQKRLTEDAARHADLVILVLHARNPGRQADVDFLRELLEFFNKQPELRKPPVLVVLTHIDLLSPSMEWSPPYNWEEPEKKKEHQINQAVHAVLEQFGSSIVGVVPVCTAPGKVYGVQDWLMPALVELLDQAHAVAFLRCIKKEKDTGTARKVMGQLLKLGLGLGNILLKPKGDAPPPPALPPDGTGTAASDPAKFP